MSEANLNDRVRQVVRDSEVITVPIDPSLSVSGEAADAKAVGDALAEKADKAELSTAVSVNGQTADAQGMILLYADDIPMSDAEGAESVKDVLEGLQEQDAGDIYMDGSAQEKVTVKAAVEELQGRDAGDIYMDGGAQARVTVKAAVEELQEELTDEEIRQMLVDAGYEEDDEA